MKKILIIVTNISKYEKINRPTGLWLGEATQFYKEVTKAGFEVDFASPKGGYVPIDPHSFKYANKSDWKLYNSEEFKNKALGNTLKPSAVNSSEYIAIYYTGGHGVIWDFLNNKELQELAQQIYEDGGYVASVCHGAIGLLNIKNRDGNYLITNKNITGFSNLEELINRTNKKVPYSTETEIKIRGANYLSKFPFKEFVVVDNRIITGQNPQSARLVAQKLLEILAPNK